MKKVLPFLLSFCFFFIISKNTISQNAVTIKPVSINFTDLSKLKANAGAQKKGVIADAGADGFERGLVLPYDLPVPENYRAKPSTIKLPATPSPNNFNTPNTSSVSPAPTVNFSALSDDIDRQTTFHIPPDTHGAIGRSQIMTVTNGEIRIQNKATGATIGSIVTLNSFWAPLAPSLGGTATSFDPKVYFDPFGDRYIFTACANGGSINSGIMIAVSKTSDPSGAWWLYGFDADGTNVNWFDYPSMGFNKNWVVVTGNMFAVSGGAFARSQIYIFDLATIKSGGAVTLGTSGGQVITSLLSTDGATFVPNLDYDNTATDIYMMQDWNGSFSGFGYIKLSKLSGSLPSSVVKSDIGFLSTAATWSASCGTCTSQNFASQSGGAALINNNDSRMQCLQLINGKLWCAQTVFYPSVTPTRSAVQWWQVTTAGAVSQVGVVDGGAGTFKAFPCIIANTAEEAVIGYSTFSSSIFASASYAYRVSTDASGTMQTEYTYKSGLEFYQKLFGGTRNRWGDYSLVTLDPTNQKFWVMQEYAETHHPSIIDPDFSALYKRWGTWWAQVPTATVLSPLAVKLVKFDAVIQDKSIRLSWQTEEENNLNKYEVQKSLNGADFTKIGEINSINASGTQNYLLIDKYPVEGYNYYRLKMLDKDGSFKYSWIVSRLFNSFFEFTKSYPNPVDKILTIELNVSMPQTVSFMIFDYAGSKLLEKRKIMQKGFNSLQINMEFLSKGNYQLAIYDESGEKRSIMKVIKN